MFCSNVFILGIVLISDANFEYIACIDEFRVSLIEYRDLDVPVYVIY